MASIVKRRNRYKVVFHSLRHSSITYKLKLNGGDVKAVQGDSGHSQTSNENDIPSNAFIELAFVLLAARALRVIRQILKGDAVIRAAVRHFSRIALSFSDSSSGVSRRPFSIQRV